MSHDHKHDSACQCASKDAFGQNLVELEYERGLWKAASSGDMDKIRSLISAGRDVNQTDSSGYTPLHYAARAGKLEVCQVLLSKGADPNSKTRAGATPLHRAGVITIIRHP